MSEIPARPIAAPRPPPAWLGWLAGAILLLGALGSWQVGDIAWANVRQYTNTPDGTYSDLAQRWVGTRAALFERRSPYSPAVVDQIQQVYYGRVIGADEPHRPLYPQGFYYPLFLVWLLAPLAVLPFPLASAAFKVLAGGLLVAGVYSTLQILGWPATRRARLALSLSGLLLPGAQLALRIDQPTVLVYGLLLGALVALWRGRMGLAGVLLALAWIKPQVAAPLTLGLGLWALADRTRWRMVIAGVLTMVALLVSSEWLVPGWVGEWLHTLNEYTTVTSGIGTAPVASGVDWVGLGMRGGLAVIVLPLWWVVRREPFAGRRLQWAVAATLVLTTLAQQPWHFTYNEILIYPALLLLLAALLEPGGRTAMPPRALAAVTLIVLLLNGLLDLLIWIDALLQPDAMLMGQTIPNMILLTDKLSWGLLLLCVLFTYAAWGLALVARPRRVVDPVAATQHHL